MPRSPGETRIVVYDDNPQNIQIIIDILRNAYPRGFSNAQIARASQGDLHVICSLYLRGPPK
jgi:hypothetical protein